MCFILIHIIETIEKHRNLHLFFMPRKRTKNLYWTQETDKAIQDYLSVDIDPITKEQIFTAIIYPAFVTMAEVFVSKYGKHLNREDTISECVTHMWKQLPNLNSKKGKAFSYLTVCGMHYVMKLNIDAEYAMNTHASINLNVHVDSNDKESDMNCLDMHMVENMVYDNSPFPDGFDFTELKQKIIEDTTVEDIENLLKQIKNWKLKTSKPVVKMKLMYFLIRLGSKHFDDVKLHTTIKTALKGNKLKFGATYLEIASLLAPLVRERYNIEYFDK